MGEELLDFGNAHFFWMAFVVEEDVVFDPGKVSVFSAGGIMLEAKGVAVLIEEFFPLRGWYPFWG